MLLYTFKHRHYWGPLYKDGLALIPVWISIHMPSKVWGEITYPFPNFNGHTIEVWERMSNVTPHFMIYVIIDPYSD